MAGRSTKLAVLIISIACITSLAIGCAKPPPNPVPTQVGLPKTVAAKAPAPEPEVPHRMFPSAAMALRYVLYKTKPQVVGFGEVHQRHSTSEIPSALSRFTTSMLPSISGDTSDLIVETWVSEGGCGGTEQAVSEDLEETTERPEATENETVTLIQSAYDFNIQPHVLELSCDDYDNIYGGKDGVDYLGLLEMIGTKIEQKAHRVLDWRAETRAKAKPMVTIYGGAIHNDAHPGRSWQEVSYGPALRKSTSDRYVEVDLFVPEFVEQSGLFVDQPWYSTFLAKSSKNQVLLIETGPSAFIIVFEKS